MPASPELPKPRSELEAELERLHALSGLLREAGRLLRDVPEADEAVRLVGDAIGDARGWPDSDDRTAEVLHFIGRDVGQRIARQSAEAALDREREAMARSLDERAARLAAELAADTAIAGGDGGAAPPEPARPVVDVSVLRGLIGDNENTVREFLADFLQAVRQQGAEIVAACRAGDHARVSAVAHKLKSSSRSIGALAFGDLCAELEGAGKAGPGTGLGPCCERFEAEMDRVTACIDDLLSGPPA